MKILTANEQFIVRKMGGYRAFIDKLVRDRWQARVNWSDVQGEVAAEIVRSSWRVSCPLCAGASVIEPDEPFFCVDCMMQANDFKPMLVVWPDKRSEIETLLLRRSDPQRRNWLPGETVGDLLKENSEHGIG